MTLEEALRIAQSRCTAPGVKPEDYLEVHDELPIWCARTIVKDAARIMKMDSVYGACGIDWSKTHMKRLWPEYIRIKDSE